MRPDASFTSLPLSKDRAFTISMRRARSAAGDRFKFISTSSWVETEMGVASTVVLSSRAVTSAADATRITPCPKTVGTSPAVEGFLWRVLREINAGGAAS